MPSWSGTRNRRPVSTTTIRPPYSTTVMFLPITRPPSGRMRSMAAKGARHPFQKALGLEGANVAR